MWNLWKVLECTTSGVLKPPYTFAFCGWGYLFAKTDLKNVLFIVQTSGVVKVIKFGAKIGIIQEEIINSIRLMIEGGYKPEPLDYFIKGDPVIVKEGPLKGLNGEVVRIDNNDRLIVRIDAIQHSVSIQIERGFLKAY